MFDEAPLANEMAGGPEGGRAYWLKTSDGVRIRVAWWQSGGDRTIFILPGRTEFIEKYALSAGEYAKRGFDTIIIDWRGQGHSDRLVANPLIGHVGRFSDYQLDLKAARSFAKQVGATNPNYMMAHSMGACIALRALQEGAPIRSVAFSGPMWGLNPSFGLRLYAKAVAMVTRVLLQDGRFAPTVEHENYMVDGSFEENDLTSDREMFDRLRMLTMGIDDIRVGGPSIRWVAEGLREVALLKSNPPPPQKALTFIGSDEQVVSPAAIADYMKRWTNGELITCEGAKHEIPIERPEIRNMFYERSSELFRST